MKTVKMSINGRPLLVFVLFLLLYNSIHATSYYIAPYGRDSNPGSLSAPWATLTYAVDQVKPGDSILVRGGKYNEGEIWIRSWMGGTDGKHLTISAYSFETPVFTNGERGMIIDASYVRVIGLQFTNGKSMYNVDWSGKSTHIELINNKFVGEYAWGAIEICGDYNLIEGNSIMLSGSVVGTQGHGIYVSHGAHMIIRNNSISGMTGYGVHIFDQRRAPDEPPRLITDILVEGNIIFNSLERAGIIVCAYDQARVQNVTIRNNIIFHHAGCGIVLRDDVSDIFIYNNTIYDINFDGDTGNGGDGISINANADKVDVRNNIISIKNSGNHIAHHQATHVHVDNNLYWPPPKRIPGISDPHAIVADPLFMDADNHQFHLRPESPAIDNGINVGLPYLGKAPDLGAYEYGTPSDTVSPVGQINSFRLKQNYPNPFNNHTVIQYSLPHETYVNIAIFDSLGKRIVTLVNGQQDKGELSVQWDGLDQNGAPVSSGVYLYRIIADNQSFIKKMLLIH